VRVVALEEPAPLVRWCGEQGMRQAVVGGFFVRPDYAPPGQVRIAGESRPSVAFEAPWGDRRACLHIADGMLRIERRDELDAEPAGDLLQAGPLLVADRPAGDRRRIGRRGVLRRSAPVRLRHHAGALSARRAWIAGERLLAVACDGRTPDDAGMTLAELADVLLELGASDALNLDGRRSASLAHDRRLRNRPREEHGIALLDGRPIVTAVTFEAR
jgi:hypothetical protein